MVGNLSYECFRIACVVYGVLGEIGQYKLGRSGSTVYADVHWCTLVNSNNNNSYSNYNNKSDGLPPPPPPPKHTHTYTH